MFGLGLNSAGHRPSRTKCLYTVAIEILQGKLLHSAAFQSIASLLVPVILIKDNSEALIDSGAAGNFIDVNLAKVHKIPLIPCAPLLTVMELDVGPLRSGRVQHLT